jgi:hypothetical protein
MIKTKSAVTLTSARTISFHDNLDVRQMKQKETKECMRTDISSHVL